MESHLIFLREHLDLDVIVEVSHSSEEMRNLLTIDTSMKYFYIYECAVRDKLCKAYPYFHKTTNDVSYHPSIEKAVYERNLYYLDHFKSLEETGDEHFYWDEVLVVSADIGDLTIMKYSLSKGVRDYYSLRNSMNKAARNGFKEIIDYLLALNVNITRTTIEYAKRSKKNSDDFIKYLESKL